MPSSAVRHFGDPDDYAASIRGAKAEMTVVGRGRFAATITRVDFRRLRLQRFSESLPRIMHSAATTGRAILSFHTQPGPSLLRGGIEVGPSSVARLGANHSYFQRSFDCSRWGSMSLPVEDMLAAGEAIIGCDLAPRAHELVITPRPAALAQLQRLHAEAGSLAENSPDIIANEQAARGLEQALIQAAVTCLDTADHTEDSAAHHRHETIMRRFHIVINEHSGEALYLPDLCARVGVPERTLRLCCNERLGMGPKHYLLLRRMALARQALYRADAATTSVTAIAADFGFWNFGRFSIEYKALFGESPSRTLRGSAP